MDKMRYSLLLQQISEEDLTAQLARLKCNKARGPCGFKTDLFKLLKNGSSLHKKATSHTKNIFYKLETYLKLGKCQK